MIFIFVLLRKLKVCREPKHNLMHHHSIYLYITKQQQQQKRKWVKNHVETAKKTQRRLRKVSRTPLKKKKWNAGVRDALKGKSPRRSHHAMHHGLGGS
tara:strand:+ start:166 stop:459 length:294 start_codon:yes stop_codon:yes gene_type:complete